MASGRSAHTTHSGSSLFKALEAAALFVLLALIPLRAVVGETHTFEVARSLRTLDAPAGASPATTFTINASIFFLTGAVLALRQWSGQGYRRTGAEWGAAILAVAMGISTWRAGQKHLALIGSIDFLGFIAYFIALSQLLHRPWQTRLALTVILATGAVMITKCAWQRYVELPETLQYYQEHKSELVSANQSNPGFIFDYEQRLKSGAVTGFFSHPNVLASYLILIILTALGVARSRLARGPAWTAAIPALLAIAGVITLAGAQSKGAAAALGMALVAWIIGDRLASEFRNRPGLAVGAAWACLLAMAVALTLTLQIKPSALGLSMQFRNFYWRASAAMIRDQDPWGVGAGNFGRFFSRYKDVECPEDVEDPHSWVVRAATEWGVLGLVGLVVVLVGISRRIATCTAGTGVAPAISQCESPAPPKGARLELPEGSLNTASIILSSAAVGLILFAGWFVTLVDAPTPFIVLTLFIPALTWFLAFPLCAYEPASGKRISDEPLPRLLAPIAAGLIGFVIHAGIDLAMFIGGAATTFFALAAVCRPQVTSTMPNHQTAIRPRGADEMRRAPRRLAACLLLLGGGFVAGAVTLVLITPCLAVDMFLQAARKSKTGLPARSYMTAADSYPQDSTALDELIDRATQAVQTAEQNEKALEMVKDFEKRDPHNALVHHYRAILHAQRFELGRRQSTSRPDGLQTQPPQRGTGGIAELDLAIDSARKAVAAYPTSPQRHLFVADLLERRAVASDSPADRARFNTDAASELQTALDLEAKRIYVSPLHRMTKEMREAIANRIARLKSQPIK